MSVDNYQYAAPFGAQTRNPFNYAKVEQIGRDSTSLWLTLDEMTNQLNLFDDTSQDGYISSLGLATRQAIEDYLGMSILPVTYRVWYGSESLVASPISPASQSTLSGTGMMRSRQCSKRSPTPTITTMPLATK
jgi:hypothetical protein